MKIKAYIPSAGEYDIVWEKYRAFVVADVSENAKANGAWSSPQHWVNEKAGYYSLRTPRAGSSSQVLCASHEGLRDWYYTHGGGCDMGLRVAFNLIYNPESSLVKGCEMVTRECKICCTKEKPENRDDKNLITIKSTAPVFEFDGKKCLWLNKEACEAGETAIMQCWTLDIVDSAKYFGVGNIDFGEATELIEQCQSQFSEEALEQMVTVEMSKKDDYEKASISFEDLPTYLFEEKNADKLEIIKDEKIKELEASFDGTRASVKEAKEIIKSINEKIDREHRKINKGKEKSEKEALQNRADFNKTLNRLRKNGSSKGD